MEPARLLDVRDPYGDVVEHAGEPTRGSNGSRASSAAPREQTPTFRNAFQFVKSAILEGETGAGDEILHGLGDQNLRCTCFRADPCADVHRNPADRVASRFDLA